MTIHIRFGDLIREIQIISRDQKEVLMSKKSRETLNNRKLMFLTTNFFILCFSITALPVLAATYMVSNKNDRGFCPFETRNGHSF